MLGLAQSSQTNGDTYTWNGELVSLDATAKSRVAYQEAISELTHFKAGDRVWIVWSGIHDSSDAVRQVRRSETGRKIDANLVLPAEFVSTEKTIGVLISDFDKAPALADVCRDAGGTS
jgi:hypothetical protein